MIAVDSNILVYAHRTDLPWHAAALRVLALLAEAEPPWAIPWPCVSEFLGVVTNRRVFQAPATIEVALRQVDRWFESPSLRLLGESRDYWERLKEVAPAGRLAGPVLHHARIAAICLANDVCELWSADRDFSRMRGLRVRNPLL